MKQKKINGGQDEADECWKFALRDLETAKGIEISRFPHAVAFYSQQSVEKGLKALALRTKGYFIKEHDLVKLALEVYAPLEIEDECSLLGKAYLSTRYYDVSIEYSPQDARELLISAEVVIAWIDSRTS